MNNSQSLGECLPTGIKEISCVFVLFSFVFRRRCGSIYMLFCFVIRLFILSSFLQNWNSCLTGMHSPIFPSTLHPIYSFQNTFLGFYHLSFRITDYGLKFGFPGLPFKVSYFDAQSSPPLLCIPVNLASLLHTFSPVICFDFPQTDRRRARKVHLEPWKNGYLLIFRDFVELPHHLW